MRNLPTRLLGAAAMLGLIGATPLYAAPPSWAPANGYYSPSQDNGYHKKRKHRDRRYANDQRVGSNTRIWRGNDGRYRCKKDNGTTGLLIGGAVGGLAGHEIAGGGDKLLGTVLGAAGGALLGREIDRDKYRCR